MALFDVSELEYMKTGVEKKKKENVEHEEITYSYEDLVHFVRELNLCEEYSDFTPEKYKYGVIFYDFEIFKYDWLVVLLEPVTKDIRVICNDMQALRKYFHEHENEIWIGYNNHHFDDVILKAIVSRCNLRPYEVMKKIMSGVREGEIGQELKRVKFKSFDVFQDPYSLKVLEGFMGNNIEESSVSFDLARPLTEDEINLTIKYCTHDVEQTLEVFRRTKADFDAQVNLMETFDLPDSSISKTQGQLTAKIVDCKRQEHDDTFDITFVPTLKLDKYAYVKEWYEEISKQQRYDGWLSGDKYAHILKRGKQKMTGDGKKVKKRTSFITTVMGVPHTFGWGGAHGAPEEPIRKNGRIFHCDVTSFYPTMMIEYGFLTRNSQSPEKFKNVYDTRVALKKAGKKKEQAPYKIILNAQYGITKDKYSEAYDPVQANNICINGQLLLLDLMEKLEAMGDHIQLLQSNTDGLFIWIDNDPKSEKWMRHICQEWINRTKMGLGFDEVGGVDTDGSPLQKVGMVQKDVNNYLALFAPKPDFVEHKAQFYDWLSSKFECTRNEGGLIKEDGWELTSEIEEKAREAGGFLDVEEKKLILRPNIKPEVKGAYVGELNDLNYDLAIINKAMVNYIIYGTSVEKTINECDSMLDFQMIARVSSAYQFAVYNGVRMQEKTFRIYASRDKNDGSISKCKYAGATYEKVSGSPDHCFIVNTDVKAMKVPQKLDRSWYMDVTNKRLADFGYDTIKKAGSLF